MSTLQESEYSTTYIVSTLRTRKRVNITTKFQKFNEEENKENIFKLEALKNRVKEIDSLAKEHHQQVTQDLQKKNFVERTELFFSSSSSLVSYLTINQ